MGALFLSGGGMNGCLPSLGKKFASCLEKGKPLLYIPIAKKYAKQPYTAYIERITNVFSPFGCSVIAWANLKNKTLEDLNDFSGVYIEGGNTFVLSQELQNSGFDSTLCSYVEQGGLLYGVSAGAIICGHSINPCFHLDSNIINLQEFAGCNLLKNHLIWCHYKPEDDHLIFRYMQEHPNPIIALPDNTGIIVEENEVQVVGATPMYLFQRNNKLALKTNFYLNSF